jgi:hypothetical protein
VGAILMPTFQTRPTTNKGGNKKKIRLVRKTRVPRTYPLLVKDL